MGVVHHITLDMCIAELQRQKQYFKEHYPRLVKKRIITPYQRDHRIKVNETLLNLLKKAKANQGTPKPSFLELLGTIPNDAQTDKTT